MRAFELSLLGKVVLAPQMRWEIGAPLWACGDCLTPLPQPVSGESKAATKVWYAAVQAIFDSYVPLTEDQRDMLFAEKELRNLLTDLDCPPEAHLELVRDLDNVVIRRIGAPGEDMFSCGDKTWRDCLRLCNPRKEIKSYKGVLWTAIYATSSERGEYLEIVPSKLLHP